MEPKEFTPQQYRKFNGQSIMLALENMGGFATADDLAEHIGASMDQPHDVVKTEVSLVLRRGIANGFFKRRGKHYFLFNEGTPYQVDGGRRGKRRINISLPFQTDGRSKRICFSPHNDDDESDMNSELEQQTIDGLRQIIAKANEETQKATILATKAARRAKLASMKIKDMVESGGSASDE